MHPTIALMCESLCYSCTREALQTCSAEPLQRIMSLNYLM